MLLLHRNSPRTVRRASECPLLGSSPSSCAPSAEDTHSRDCPPSAALAGPRRPSSAPQAAAMARDAPSPLGGKCALLLLAFLAVGGKCRRRRRNCLPSAASPNNRSEIAALIGTLAGSALCVSRSDFSLFLLRRFFAVRLLRRRRLGIIFALPCLTFCLAT